MTETAPPILLPEVLGEQSENAEALLQLRIPEGLAYFSGHFPAVPIVPGVVQIGWAVHFARHCFGLAHPFRQLEAVKFKELMLPGQTPELHLQYAAEAARVRFCFRAASVEYSSGRIYFHGNPL